MNDHQKITMGIREINEKQINPQRDAKSRTYRVQ
jgi:hypothetical protein